MRAPLVSKKEARLSILKELRSWSKKKRLAKSSIVLQHFQAWLEAQDSQPSSIGLYAAQNCEVETKIFLSFLQKSYPSILCAFPKVDVLLKQLNYVPIQSWNELTKGKYGILEPLKSPADSILIPDVILVPGLQFSLKGERLGWGGGYFDRAIHRWKKNESGFPIWVGLCFQEQLLPLFPESWRESHDQCVDAVISD